MLGHTTHIVSLSEGQAAADDKVRDATFERTCWSVKDITLVDQIETDLRTKCFVIPSAGHLTKAAADVSGSVMGPGPVAIASAVDIVDQLSWKIRIARK